MLPFEHWLPLHRLAVAALLFSETWIERVELAWLQTQDKSEAERREREFRTLYKREYRRRPLWDLQG